MLPRITYSSKYMKGPRGRFFLGGEPSAFMQGCTNRLAGRENCARWFYAGATASLMLGPGQVQHQIQEANSPNAGK